MPSPATFMINITVTTNAKLKAKHSNEFFTSIARKINSKIIFFHFSFRGQANNDLLFITSVTAEEITDIVDTKKHNKANNPNSIPSSIVKQYKKELSIPLNIFQGSFFRPPKNNQCHSHSECNNY